MPKKRKKKRPRMSEQKVSVGDKVNFKGGVAFAIQPSSQSQKSTKTQWKTFRWPRSCGLTIWKKALRSLKFQWPSLKWRRTPESPLRQFPVQNPLADQPRDDFPHLVKSVGFPQFVTASAFADIPLKMLRRNVVIHSVIPALEH